MNITLNWIIIGLPAFILAGVVHEYMHAWTAKKLGDYTATTEGRLTLNPIAHLDPIGFILMVVARFGWMKPVPINEYNFENPKRDMAIVAFAGPMSNLGLAILSALILNILPTTPAVTESVMSGDGVLLFITTVLYFFLYVNLVLMLFNLIPIPPLDGSRIVRAVLPANLQYYWEELEKFAPIIILLLLLPFSPIRGILTAYLSGSIEFFIGLLLI
jgi:Zn-dependent protease